MSFGTKIAYCHATFNPWMGCTKISTGCQRCFAERWAKRSGMVEWGPGKPRRRTSESYWKQPLKWNKQAEKEATRYLVLTDLCDPLDMEIPVGWFTDFLSLILRTPRLDWLFLTKRIDNWRHCIARMKTYGKVSGDERMEYLGDSLSDGIKIPNLWLGITVCNQAEADRDIPILLSIPAVKHWLSIEPMLGPINITPFIGGKAHKCECGWHETELKLFPMNRKMYHPNCGMFTKDYDAVKWIVCGGESGVGARPMHPDWVRSVRDQCQSAGVPFFFKSWGEWLPSGQSVDAMYDELLDSANTHEWPDANPRHSFRIGTKAAGNLLDGQKWEQLPE